MTRFAVQDLRPPLDGRGRGVVSRVTGEPGDHARSIVTIDRLITAACDLDGLETGVQQESDSADAVINDSIVGESDVIRVVAATMPAPQPPRHQQFA